MPSRRLEDLEPDVAEACRLHVKRMERHGIKLVVYQTRRTLEEQALYYAQGRRLDELPAEVVKLIEPTVMKWKSQGLLVGPGPRVTNALPNPNAPHVRGIAYDCAPEVFGRVAWSDADLPPELREQTDWNGLWYLIGEQGERSGMEWGGRWKHRPDKPHFQRRKKYDA